MNAVDFIYKHAAKVLEVKFPKATQGEIARAAGVARDYFKQHGNFAKGKVFDECVAKGGETLKITKSRKSKSTSK